MWNHTAYQFYPDKHKKLLYLFKYLNKKWVLLKQVWNDSVDYKSFLSAIRRNQETRWVSLLYTYVTNKLDFRYSNNFIALQNS